MASKSETAWEKAAACDAHAKQTRDENLRAKFERLRDSWIRIANNAQVIPATQGERGEAGGQPGGPRRPGAEGTVPDERFELPTNGLQNRCSTAELTRHKWLFFFLYQARHRREI